MKKKAVTQCSLYGKIVARFESAAHAAKITGCHASNIQHCCLGNLNQTNGYIWVHSDKENTIEDRVNNLFNPKLPEEWGKTWKDVKGYKGIYKVSEKGIVISLPRALKVSNNAYRYQKLYKLKPHQNKLGYWIINLSKNYTNDLTFLHRVIAEAFIPNPNNYPYINHKDENPANYSIDNLEWCTHEYNMNYGTRNKRIAEKNINGKLSKPVLQLNMDGNVIKEWVSIAEAARHGFRQSAISNCCAGRINTHKGFKWKFKTSI